MGHHILLALTSAVAGKESEFDDWYDLQHIPDVLRVPGFAEARRFALAEASLDRADIQPCPYRSLTVYEVDGDPATALKTLDERMRAGTIALSPAVDMSRTAAWLFVPIREQVAAPSGRPPQPDGT